MGNFLSTKKIYTNYIYCIYCKKLCQTKKFDCEHSYCDSCILKLDRRCPFCHCKLTTKHDQNSQLIQNLKDNGGMFIS